ncbi:MAG TPA: MG2 domain-containing protein [Steroidobacteraceae bacterium]|jgi:hypothetical protein|nr:MG2 domain-containing protein [Steroidobacteraceae bacterium]
MRHLRRLLLTAAACLSSVPLLAATAPATARAPQVGLFSPQGYVRRVRQVQVRFSTPMVALGDPRLADPFIIDCPAAGQGRWADPTNWVYDFNSDLDAGVRCQFTLRPGLVSLAGAPLAGPSNFAFNTGGPAIIASLPRSGWIQIDESQIFLLRLDAPAVQASIEANAYCAIDGIVERVPVQVLTGAARQAVLDERRALGYDYLQLLFKNGAVFDLRARNRAMERSREQLLSVVRCRRQLPPATRVLLHWGAGITTPSGIATLTDQQLAFRVRSAFTAQVQCSRSNPRAGCMPMLPINVVFTAPVLRAQLLAIRLRTADGRLLTPMVRDSAAPTLEEVSFPGPFPESATLTVLLPGSLVDDAGRTLANAARFPLPMQIDVYPPLVKFSGTFGILEAREGGVLPVTLRNIGSDAAPSSGVAAEMLRVADTPDSIVEWLKRVENANRRSGHWIDATEAGSPDTSDAERPGTRLGTRLGTRPRRIWLDTTGLQSVFTSSDQPLGFTVAKPAGPKPAEVVGIPLKRPGLYVVEIASDALGQALSGREVTRYVATAALVTDLAVHFKWGRESSLIWVTRLSSGKPVEHVDVSIADACDGSTLWDGRTDGSGLAAVAQSFGEPMGFEGCYALHHPLIVLAHQGEDFSFTESGWDQGIMPYEFGLPVGGDFATGIYHTVLDRSLFRAGDTVSMQHFLRRHVSDGIALLPGGAGSHQVTISHLGSGQRYELTTLFDADGVGSSSWKIPEEAKLGDYSISIDGHRSGDFKVEQFRLPTMRASVSGPARPQVSPAEVSLDLHVAYLSGGGAGGLPVKLRTLIEPQVPHFADYPDYQFGGAPVHEGISSGDVGPLDFDFESEAGTQPGHTQTIPVALDGAGSARVTVAHLPALDGPSRLTAELEYADANGETLTTSGYVRLVPAAIFLGLRPDSWVGSPGQLRFRVLALNLDGKPLARQLVQVSLYQSSAYSYRKRLIGGFYSYETTREIRRLSPSCSGRTNAQGLLVCELAPGVSGQIIARAQSRDAQGRAVGATTSMWVYDKSAWWFGGTSGDRMDVLPEKKEYEAGDTARLQVRMPFRDATALVTVEREGVLRSFVTHLHGNVPIIRVPIDPHDAPNVFVSVLAVRGRVVHADPGAAGSAADEVTGLVDLTKPAYRLGTAQIKVGWRSFRLDVRVQPQRRIYKVRDHVAVSIHVQPADGHALPPHSAVTVAAVDEALLDLSANSSWQLLDAMMGERGLEVWTSTAQMQVVGKRHYGRKAVPQGGGGGRELDRSRQLFDSLLYWQPEVPLNEHGNASVSIPLNDSLSSFRIVAVAHGGIQLFGTGDATVTTTQDLMLLAGLPPLVREGDHYDAVFTVRNTTSHAVTAQVDATSSQISGILPSQTVQIAAGSSRDVLWQVVAPVGPTRIDWDVKARELAGEATDHLQVHQTLIPAVPVRTYQATISQLSAPVSIPVRRPQDALPGRGGLEIMLQPQLAGSLAGVREYMSLYPYSCLEQLASRAIALRSRDDWDALMQRLPAFTDEDGLLRYFATDALQGDDSLTAYVLTIADVADWPVPAPDRVRLVRGLMRFVNGQITRDSALPTADLAIRKLQAINALSRYGAAQASMLDSITLEPNLMPTSALLDWIDILERVPDVPGADQLLQQAFGLLRTRLNFQGTTLGFSTERSDALWWLMISEDSNANRLLLAALDRPDWRPDVPRLVRGALARQQFGHWNTTVANAWGVLAVEKFSAQFESVPVTGTTQIHYGSTQRTQSWPLSDATAQTSLPWQSGVDAGPGVLRVNQTGSGAPWVMVRATAALPLQQPFSSGFRIVRTVLAVQQRRPGVWMRGDVARVHLQIEAQSDMSWVVIDDPIPAGASILGSGLGGQSALLQRGEQQSGVAWLAFEERRFDAYRAYYRFVPKGQWTLDYTVRLNNPGTFELPSTRVEAMYAPEMLGELPNAPFTIVASTSP